MSDPLAAPLTLPCGVTLPNRLAKAAMTEGLADQYLQPTARHETLYRRWGEGGAGLLLTGNVMIDARVLERPGNVAIDVSQPLPPELRERLRRWAAAATAGGAQAFMQISHAGRQSPRYVTREPLAPSAVGLDLLGSFATPRSVTAQEIADFTNRFAQVAALARDAGFTGVQVHAAHGYLLSSFLSGVTNLRTDAWGGSLANRARMLLDVLRAVRAAVGAGFPVSVKLNSDDFRKGGFSHSECLQVVEWLNAERIDLLEISGGSYEQPRLLGFSGRARDASEPPQRESTLRREAYFLEYAAAIRKVATMPLMVTGGFRTRATMEAALAAGHTDLIGLGRPLCTDADAPRRLLAREIDALPAFEQRLQLSRWRWLSGASPLTLFKFLNVQGAQGWYYQQLFRLAAGAPPDLSLGLLRACCLHYLDELAQARRVHRARRRRTAP